MIDIDFKPEGTLVNKGNAFYIYSEIDSGLLDKIIIPFIEEVDRQSRLKNGAIKIYINSGGGDLYCTKEFIALIEDAIKKGVEIETYVLSWAASAATLIAVAGSKRYVSKGAKQLIHYPMGGDYKETITQNENGAKDYAYEVKYAVEHYEKYCKIPDLKDKLNEGNHTIYGGKNLVKYGLADYII